MKRIVAFLVMLLMMFAVIGLSACDAQVPAPEVPDSPQAPADGNGAPDTAEPADENFKIVTVVKFTGITWFDRLEEGVQQFANDTGIDATMVGPSKADVALQVQMVEDLIAQNVDAICVVPLSPEAMDPILKKARDKGIVVISHEANNLVNIDYNIEGFDNTVYGEQMMELLAQEMGGKGEYVTSVGSLTAASHNLWEEAAVAYQEEHYPEMTAVERKIENLDDQKAIYEKVREVLKAHPNVTGFFGMGAQSPPGAALAIEEMGLAGKVKIIGTGIVSVSGKYLEDGTIKAVVTWDPKTSGYAMCKLAQVILEGRQDEIKNGMDLGLPGYESVKLDGNLMEGNDIVAITKENMADYNF